MGPRTGSNPVDINRFRSHSGKIFQLSSKFNNCKIKIFTIELNRFKLPFTWKFLSGEYLPLEDICSWEYLSLKDNCSLEYLSLEDISSWEYLSLEVGCSCLRPVSILFPGKKIKIFFSRRGTLMFRLIYDPYCPNYIVNILIYSNPLTPDKN